MGILDQLREEAEQKKSSEQLALDLEAQRKQNYETRILPKMQQIFKYLQELVEHLNYLEVPVQVENYTTRFSKLGTLAQKNYKISSDDFGGFADMDKLMQINLTFLCVGEGEFEYKISGKQAIENEIAYLHAKRLTVKTKNLLIAHNNETTRFIVKRSIPVRFRFAVDYDNSVIKVIINNNGNFSTYTELWQAEDINEQFLDEIACYLLRKDTKFIKPAISDEQREVLRKKLAVIKNVERQDRG
ncbi:MAG: hypothetical protein GQ582_11665 [Methyloprofundus sp.]|nr:hypothetical protein [Methyloprofundus sp.]